MERGLIYAWITNNEDGGSGRNIFIALLKINVWRKFLTNERFNFSENFISWRIFCRRSKINVHVRFYEIFFDNPV